MDNTGQLRQSLITLDVDWAPDYAIDITAAILIGYNCKATWFVTHNSPAIERLRDRDDLFELGIHPNFLDGSTHGRTQREVMDYICSVVPGARSMRTHGLYQSTPMLKMANGDYGIEVETAMLLHKTPNIEPHFLHLGNGTKGLLRVPFFFEDDVEMFNPDMCWDIDSPSYHVDGLKVYNFHPVYIYLNSDSMQPYQQLKGMGHLMDIARDTFDEFVNADRPGSATLFKGLCSYIGKVWGRSYTISEVEGLWTRRV